MTLPVPNLDDRRFQDLVDDAKRLVQHRCPEWTDHNVSDPGVTLIETFAFMVDQLLYRLNRVPDKLYVRFLELLGVRLFPPTAATVHITFWLSASQPTTVTIPAGTQVATVRTDSDDAVPFVTVEDLPVVASSLLTVASSVQDQELRKRLAQLRSGNGFYCFDRPPQPGDSLLIGLTSPVPSCAVLLHFECEVEGVGVDPTDPPLVWEAWTGDGWTPCWVDRDGTGGLNRAGDVVLHVPRSHVASAIAGDGAGWIRCRVTPSREGQPAYSASPKIMAIEASTIGGTALAANAEEIEGEVLGLSEGVPGQRFSVKYGPVVAAVEEPAVLEVSDGDGWTPWREVDTFADSRPEDHHFVFTRSAGEIQLGPGVREGDGTLRVYGAVPPKGATVRLRSYRHGGGRQGNVSAGAITVLKTSIPYVGRVENRGAASGGIDGETLDEAKVRGPVTLRTRSRAVTPEDFEVLAREAAPAIARVRCVAAGDGADPGSVRVLVVPARRNRANGVLRFEELLPDEHQLATIAAYLDERRIIGTRVVVEPPFYQGITVVARVRPRPRVSPDRLEREALDALYRYLDPIDGGPDGSGWPFGRRVNMGDVYSVLQRLPGTELVEDARLFAADPTTGKRGPATDRLDIDRHALLFSYQHQVRVERV